MNLKDEEQEEDESDDFEEQLDKSEDVSNIIDIDYPFCYSFSFLFFTQEGTDLNLWAYFGWLLYLQLRKYSWYSCFASGMH